MEEVLFYNIYDFNFGYNIVVIFGGLLLFIFMYVFYRIKICKFLIKFVKEKLKVFRNELIVVNDIEEIEEVFMCDIEDKFYNVGFRSFKSESENLDLVGLYNYRQYRFGDIIQYFVDDVFMVFQVIIIDDLYDFLFIVFMDIDDCIVEWVYKQYEFLYLGGIIVKVKFDMICFFISDFLEEGKG